MPDLHGEVNNEKSKHQWDLMTRKTLVTLQTKWKGGLELGRNIKDSEK